MNFTIAFCAKFHLQQNIYSSLQRAVFGIKTILDCSTIGFSLSEFRVLDVAHCNKT